MDGKGSSPHRRPDPRGRCQDARRSEANCEKSAAAPALNDRDALPAWLKAYRGIQGVNLRASRQLGSIRIGPRYFSNLARSFGAITARSAKTSVEVWAIPEQQPRAVLYPACFTTATVAAL